MTSYDDNLLTAVSQHPILYNHMRRDYKNSEAKIKAWEEIQKELDVDEPIEKIRQRWKSIRDSYVKYINKTRDRAGSKVRPYKFEKQLKFLKPFLAGQKDGLLQFDDDSHLETTEQVVLTVTPCHEESTETIESNLSSDRRKKSAKTDSLIYENHETSAVSSDYRLFSQMDDIDVFFYGLAQTMRKLRPLTVAKLKKEMANLVTDAEIHELEEVENGDVYKITRS